MTDEKQEKKQPLNMTTDEAMDYLFPKEVVERLKEVAQGKPSPPTGDDKGSTEKGNLPREE
jgi:hypothetical protein